MSENETARIIYNAAIEAHRILGGPGLLESVYEEALCHELHLRGCKVVRQQQVPVRYKGVELGEPFRLDALVNGCVIVECKALAQYNAIFEVQLLTYLRLTGCKLGVVINFGEQYVSKGFRRVVNGL